MGTQFRLGGFEPDALSCRAEALKYFEKRVACSGACMRSAFLPPTADVMNPLAILYRFMLALRQRALSLEHFFECGLSTFFARNISNVLTRLLLNFLVQLGCGPKRG